MRLRMLAFLCATLAPALPAQSGGVTPEHFEQGIRPLLKQDCLGCHSTEKHSTDPKCFGCHRRIDGYGYALEGYDAIGRARTRDLGDRPIDTRAKLFDGTPVAGADGLRDYLQNKKRAVVLRQFCRKLLGYALGCGGQLSDKALLTEMPRQLCEHDYRFSAALETIVRSQQFREIRGKEVASEE